ncbi:lipopolysaccharide biosynthesis protein [Neolewinella agarilytica]|uniref:Membrane protein involved in the export of O-antigen and teichoic acid n=1 Tax=Neolewinella agarilytica TaxID=478744 RepID=A0A1H9GMC8_9BACT|nr:hypothetical protein [Neolewinella agarilytica]SEQ51246.1 Membrane protein involved in the export of O-antigen and teichoic acid [Neolewinella agarilytica]
MLKQLDKLATQYPFVSKWTKLIGVAAGGQLAIQAVGFISGILVIRLLPTEQYAYYVLVNTMLGTMAVLADGGISLGVLSEGGKVWQQPKELGKVLATGMDLRHKFAIGSLAVSMPILYYLLRQQELSHLWVIILILSLLPSFYASLSGGLLKVVPRLHQEVSSSLMIDLKSNIWRALATAGSLLFFPLAVCAVLANGVGQIKANQLLKKLSQKHIAENSQSDDFYRSQILKTVWRVLPGSIYYCISGQITVWLISIFGSTSGIAEIGALGRLMVLLMLIQNSLDLLIVPRFARLMERPEELRLRFIQVVGAVSGISLCLILGIYLFPKPFLFILGPDYMDLEYEMLLMTIGSCITLVANTVNRLASARGIIPNPALFLPFTVFSQIVLLVFFIDYSSVVGVLNFSILGAAIGLLYRIIHFFTYNLSSE